MRSPSLDAYLLGFGFPLLLCAAGLAVGWGQLVKNYWHVVLWFVLSVIFSYLPIWFQRKLIFGAHIPLCIVAAISFDMILAGFSRRWTRRWAMVAAAVILLPLLASTSGYLLVSQSREVRGNADGAYFVSNEVMAGLRFLKDRSKPDEIVFAMPATSRLIPAFSGNTVLWGHWAMSVDYAEREKWFADIFGEESNWDHDRRSREFWAAGIEYIFADEAFQRSLAEHPLAWRGMLKETDIVFENASVTIYRRRGR